MKAFIDSVKCHGCGVCVDVCPAEAIVLRNGKAKVDGEKCFGCGACVNSCPQSAITMKKDECRA